MEDNGTVTKHM